MNKEVAMTELDKGQKTDQSPKKHLWFGYGNYGGLPNIQIGGGYVRDPSLFEKLTENPKTARSPMTFFMCAVSALIGLMVFVMLLAWGISLVIR